jgi:hypothetical protein
VWEFAAPIDRECAVMAESPRMRVRFFPTQSTGAQAKARASKMDQHPESSPMPTMTSDWFVERLKALGIGGS